MNTSTIISALKISTFGLFLMVFLAGCQTQNEIDEAFQEAAQLRENEDCEEGSTHYFDLEQLSNPNVDYAFQLTNTGGPYTLNDCVCNITKYELTFTSVPSNVVVTDQFQNPIPFSIETDASTGNQTIVIYPGSMNDATAEIHVSFDVAPALVSAGGLCVVDNLSGTGTTTIDKEMVHATPAHVSYMESPSFMVHKWMIPTTMTTKTLR